MESLNQFIPVEGLSEFVQDKLYITNNGLVVRYKGKNKHGWNEWTSDEWPGAEMIGNINLWPRNENPIP